MGNYVVYIGTYIFDYIDTYLHFATSKGSHSCSKYVYIIL